MNRVPTIEGALARHAVPVQEVARRYPGPAALVRRILGVATRAAGLFEIWPPALTTYNLLVPAMFDVPKCDIGLGISPELRAMVAHATSRSFGCRYCMAHTAIMGTLVRGPADELELSGRIVAARGKGQLSKAERIAIDYATAVAAVPDRVTPELMQALHGVYRPDQVEAIALVAVCMGYLNRFMDTLGTTLETAVYDAVSEKLEESGWEPGVHYDAEAMREDREQGRATLARRPSRLGLFREIPNALAYERAALANVPKSPEGQSARLREVLGFVPYYVEHVQRASARRVFTHILLERLHPSGVDVDAAVKALLGWISARAAGNDVLAAHFAFMAVRAGADVDRLAAALVRPDSPGASAEAAALALAHETTAAGGTVSAGIIDALVQHHSPASIIELLVVLSSACALQRYVATFPPDALEPEIERFVATHTLPTHA
jgi:alkylhydroperoxidase family enzyme